HAVVQSILSDSGEHWDFVYDPDGAPLIFFRLEPQSWDTAHFGFKCFKVRHFMVCQKLSLKQLTEAAQIVSKQFQKVLKDVGARFVFWDVDNSCANMNEFVQQLGFKHVVNWIDGF